MDEHFEYTISDEERAARRASRTAARLERQHRERLRLIKKLATVGGACLVLVLCVTLIGGIVKGIANRDTPEDPDTNIGTNNDPITAEKPDLDT